MPDEFQSAKQHAKELEEANSARNTMFEDMENMYWMRWPEESAVKNQIKNVKVTRTPRARNALLGAKRLMIATDPIISVPYDINNPDAKEKGEKLEKFLKACFFNLGAFQFFFSGLDLDPHCLDLLIQSGFLLK